MVDCWFPASTRIIQQSDGLMNYVLGLKCKECGHRVPVSPVHVCEQCFGPYEVEYDYAAMKGKVTRESIAAGPQSLWRYKDLLPVERAARPASTPASRRCEKADRLGQRTGLHRSLDQG